MYIHVEGSIECMKSNIDWIFRHCVGAACIAVVHGGREEGGGCLRIADAT